jgi:hypothetical protein
MASTSIVSETFQLPNTASSVKGIVKPHSAKPSAIWFKLATGILRSWESIGSTIAYAVGATHWSNLNQMALGFLPNTASSVKGIVKPHSAKPSAIWFKLDQ